MKQSSLLRWTQSRSDTGSSSSSSGSKKWIHPPDALERGHIVYLVKVGYTYTDMILFLAHLHLFEHYFELSEGASGYPRTMPTTTLLLILLLMILYSFSVAHK